MQFRGYILLIFGKKHHFSPYHMRHISNKQGDCTCFYFLLSDHIFFCSSAPVQITRSMTPSSFVLFALSVVLSIF